jgi:hypothetical protein
MTMTADDLLARLPAFFRERDERQGGALRALLQVIAAQGAVLEADIARLYDDWFIETCDDWLVPYIGDLLGVRGLYGVEGTAAFGARALVANTLRTRRRKGTVPALEQVARDSAGWPAHAVEFFQRMQATQSVNHLRPQCLRTPDLRDAAALERFGGAFETAAHLAEVRPLPSGRYDIPNVGVFVWRLQACPVQRAVATPHPLTPGLYFIDPLSRDTSLFNPPQAETDIVQLSGPLHVPEPLTRRVLHDELAALRQAIADGDEPAPGRFPADDNGAALRVWLDGARVAPERFVICDLDPLPGVVPEDWRRPPASLDVVSTRPGRGTTTFPRTAGELLVGIDPMRGRLALPAGKTVTRVEVASAYGFPGDVGAGPYDRRPASRAADADSGLLDPADFVDEVEVPGDFATLAAAIAAVVPNRSTLIRWDSDSAEALSPVIALPNTHLAIEAVNRRRPVIVGDVAFSGDAGSRLSLSGVTLAGRLALSGPLAAVDLRHCTLVPSGGGLAHTGSGPTLQIRMRRTLCGKLATAQAIAGLDADECAFDAAGGVAVRVVDAPATLSRCTVFGRTQAGELEASNCLFTERVLIDRLQQGCVRFSYVTGDSVTPRQYRCQPDGVTRPLLPAHPAEAAAEAIRVTPGFTSATFGDPAYAQLLRSCAPEIRGGADDGAEMGVWNLLKQPQREANLRQSLDEYLRFGLEAGVIFVN